MKLNVLSDLHLGVAGLPQPRNDADLVVLAGDIARPREAMAWALALAKPVLYVPGNHEFYGGSLAATVDELRRLSSGTQVRMLDNDEVVVGGVRFLGTTLWTDFMLLGGEQRLAAMEEASRFMRDFSRIRGSEEDPFTPADAAALFAANIAWLETRLAAPHSGPTVVVTHHAPSPRSVHPRFAGSRLNAAFVSDAESLLERCGAQLWIHGHTHDSFDYRVGATRVVCNPRGYSKEGVNENSRFDPDLVVEIAGGKPTRDRHSKLRI